MSPTPLFWIFVFEDSSNCPTNPGTALHNKIESRLEKSLGSQFNIQLQQQMGGLLSVHAGGFEVSPRWNAVNKKSLQGGGR